MKINFALICFVVSSSFLLLLFGTVFGYANSALVRSFLKDVKTVVSDFIWNPLTNDNRYSTEPGLVFYQDFDDDGYILMSGYLVDEERIGIRLIDLANRTVVKSWSGHSEIYVITPGNGEVETPYTNILAQERVGTPTQGLAQILTNGDVFIEETEYGRMLRVSQSGLVWSYYNSDGKISGVLNWSRYIPKEYLENVEFLPACDQ